MMPLLSKATNASVDLIPQLGRDGDMVLVVILKERFFVSRRDRVERVGDAEKSARQTSSGTKTSPTRAA